MYSYVIEVADTESDLGLHDKSLISEMFVFYYFLENAQGWPGRRGYVNLGQYFLMFFRVLRVFKGSELVCIVIVTFVLTNSKILY